MKEEEKRRTFGIAIRVVAASASEWTKNELQILFHSPVRQTQGPEHPPRGGRSQPRSRDSPGYGVVAFAFIGVPSRLEVSLAFLLRLRGRRAGSFAGSREFWI